jgi:hypothetical protein
MVELVVAIVELFVQVLLGAFHLFVVIIELIGGLIGLVFERLDRGGTRAGSTSTEASASESDT